MAKSPSPLLMVVSAARPRVHARMVSKRAIMGHRPSECIIQSLLIALGIRAFQPVEDVRIDPDCDRLLYRFPIPEMPLGEIRNLWDVGQIDFLSKLLNPLRSKLACTSFHICVAPPSLKL